MARRKRRWHPIGDRLRTAREKAGLTRSRLAKRTGISTSSLARFELDSALPSFDDVCILARELGWPLLYFATGRTRSGRDVRSTTAQLRFWGLHDLQAAELLLFGEAFLFEDLVAEVTAGLTDPRVLEALPALLLRNAFETGELISRARSVGSLIRVGWLADVAAHVAQQLPIEAVQPEASRRLHALRKAGAADSAQQPDTNEIDFVVSAGPASVEARDRLWQASPALTRRWRIACDISLDQFRERAESILKGA